MPARPYWIGSIRLSPVMLPVQVFSAVESAASMPLDWKELTCNPRSDAFDATNVPAWLKRRKRDPWKEFFALRQTIDHKLFK